MSHTPGPWKVDEDGFVWGYLPGSHMKEPRFLIAQVRGWGYMQYMQGGEQIHAANARLIAAAPELLEVCEALLALNNTLVVELSESDWLKYKREAERKAKAALAKARGDEGEGC